MAPIFCSSQLYFSDFTVIADRRVKEMAEHRKWYGGWVSHSVSEERLLANSTHNHLKEVLIVKQLLACEVSQLVLGV